MNLHPRAHFFVNINLYCTLLIDTVYTLDKWSKTVTVPLLGKLLMHFFHDIWGSMKYIAFCMNLQATFRDSLASQP